MTMTTSDDDDNGHDDDDYHTKIFEKRECAVLLYKRNISANVPARAHILQPKYCLLITKPSAQRAYHITHIHTIHMYIIIIIAFRFGAMALCCVCSRCNVARPVNLIRYFMRPNVSSYDCLFRIFSHSFSLVVRCTEQFYFIAFTIVSAAYSAPLLLQSLRCC